MNTIYPVEINQIKENELSIKWNDGRISIFNIRFLREQCPCANCKGETILLKTIKPVKPEFETPEMFMLKSISAVGNYAIQIAWKDGHDTGIYSWEYLLDIDDIKTAGEKYKPIMED